jgi:hypothetical protein
MKKLFFVTEKFKKKANKLDKFVNTYLRCFDKDDIKKVTRKNHLGNFSMSLYLGPFPALATVWFPYDYAYSEFFKLPFIYELPAYALVFFLSREILGGIGIRRQVRFKQKMFNKYQPQMDMDKERIQELEYEENLLKIENKNKN